ncbi:MAG: hypothetical protein IJ561_00040 [Ruminococcus sp.]|nr:hypothetical protein [Ruminococcus sp.]
MKCRIIKSVVSGTVTAVLALTTAISASAADVSVANNLFENDVWSGETSWTINCEWAANEKIETQTYDEWAGTPSSGSTKGLNFYSEGGSKASATQTVTVPAGEYTVTVLFMGNNSTVSASVGSTKSDAGSTTSWGDWQSISFDVTGTGASEEIAINIDMAAGGDAMVDSIIFKEKSSSSDTGSDTDTGSTDTGSTDTGSSDTGSSDTGSSTDTDDKTNTDSNTESGQQQETPSEQPASQGVSGQIVNGDFETVSDTELVGWEVAWDDEKLSLWYANDTDKGARSNTSNNYLNIWTKAAVPLSVKQTVHLVPGKYKVTFNLDANEGVDTKVQLKVGNLTTYTLPKGEGWEKWTPCTTDVFTVTEEGDYEISFVGDVPAETWLALDNVKLANADDSTPSKTGAAENTAAAAALLAAASVGIALSKKNKKQ